MSWQDFEYGPADDGADFFIDAGWIDPDEAQELRDKIAELNIEIEREQRRGLFMFLGLLGVLAISLAACSTPARASDESTRAIENAIRRGDAVLVAPRNSVVIPTRTRVRALMRRPTTVIVVPTRRRYPSAPVR